MAGKSVSVTIVRDDVCVVRVNDVSMKVNALGKALTEDLKWAFDQIENDESVKSVVLISGKPECFFAGADISMLQKTQSVEEATQISHDAQAYFDRIERSAKPVVAAIMGTCMGAGVEIALACDYRIAVNNASTILSLPEVKLGLLPGAGGTQRLPKLVSVGDALDMILTGRNVKPKRARQMGLVDLLVQEHRTETHDYLEEVAVEIAKGLSSGEIKINRKRALIHEISNIVLTTKFALENVVLKKAKENIDRVTGGHFLAPYEILNVVKSGILDEREVGFRNEAEAFGRLAQTAQCKALIGLFMGQTMCKKNRYGNKEKISKIAVEVNYNAANLISMALEKEVEVVLFGSNIDALEAAMNAIHSHLKRRQPEEFERLMANLNVFDSLSAFTFSKCQVVFCENFEKIKELISNDSAIVLQPSRTEESFNDMRVLRLRFHAENQMAQIIPIIDTSKEAVAILANFFSALKTMVVKSAFDGKGFYEEAVKLVAEGISAKLVDEYLKAAGWGNEVLNDAKKEGYAVDESDAASCCNVPIKEDVQMRLLCAFINDALKTLESKAVESPVDLDMLSVTVFGFPVHLGGPCRYADMCGTEKLISEMRRFGITPCESLIKGIRFH